MYRQTSFALLALALAACGNTPKQDTKAVADAPAVIAAPLNLPAHEIPSDTKRSTLIPADPNVRTSSVMTGYSLMAATMVHQDGRMLGSLYAPNAVLRTQDSTLTGAKAIVSHLLAMTKARSIVDFQRTSSAIRVLDDSTLSDSGTYVITSRRQAADSVMQTGSYTAQWRVRLGNADWVILEDHIMAGRLVKPAGGKAAKKTK